MKGIIFNEFLGLVEEKFGVVMLDSVITEANLGHGGVYTSVGTYDFDELARLVQALHEQSEIAVPDLMYTFGHYLFGGFQRRFPDLVDESGDALSFLLGLENVIHAEVRKLYPDAELPSFDNRMIDDNTLEMLYESPRRLSVFARGLIDACAEHFDDPLEVVEEDLSGGSGQKVRFRLTRVPERA